MAPVDDVSRCCDGLRYLAPYHLGLPITQHHERQGGQIKHSKYLLRQEDICPPVGDVVESGVYVDVRCWIDQWPCTPLDLPVVPLSSNILGHLFHVRNPVNFRVYHDKSATSLPLMLARLRFSFLQGTFHMIRTQSNASNSQRAGGTSLESA